MRAGGSLLALLSYLGSASSFTAAPIDGGSCRRSSPRPLGLASDLRRRDGSRSSAGGARDPPRDPCPDPEGDDPSLDRREAAFAMIGRLWAAGAVPASVLGGGTAPSGAVYGADAKIALPNPIEAISDRATKQCIVESLGNRECLVYMDPENKLYQGADAQVLLGRIEKCSEALASIPDLVAERKWSKVLGVITGPMGTLGGTMDQLIKLGEGGGGKAAENAKRVKADIYAIAAAVERKQGDAALKYHQHATEDLVAFIKSL